LVFFAGFAPAAQISGRMLDKRGARPCLLIGGVLGTAGFALWASRLTELNLSSQWWAIVLAGAGIGFILGPASTDSVNRAIGTSYGEVTGISQTVRNYAASLGLAVLGTLLSNVFASRLTDSLVASGLPSDQAGEIARQAAASGSGSSGSGGAMPAALAQSVAHDFAVANQAVFYGMAIALAVSLGLAFLHPGGRVTDPTETPDTETPDEATVAA